MAEGRFAAAALKAFATSLVERAGVWHHAGNATDNPYALYAEPKGALLPWAEKLGVDIPGRTAS